MAPQALQFEFTPRRQRWWLRLLLAGLCIGLTGVVAAAWWQRQTEIERLQAATRAMQEKAAASAAPASAARANPAWMAAAQQDGRDLTPIADMRLLEIERCVAGPAAATRVTLDAAAVTTVELQLADLKDSATVLACLNEGIEGGRWRLVGLSAAPRLDAGASPAAKAMLRFEPLQR